MSNQQILPKPLKVTGHLQLRIPLSSPVSSPAAPETIHFHRDYTIEYLLYPLDKMFAFRGATNRTISRSSHQRLPEAPASVTCMDDRGPLAGQCRSNLSSPTRNLGDNERPFGALLQHCHPRALKEASPLASIILFMQTQNSVFLQ